MLRTQKTRKSQASYTIGIDLGGTKVAAALVDAKGSILSEARRPTVPPEFADLDPRELERNPSESEVREHIAYVIRAIGEAVEEVYNSRPSTKTKIRGIGLASAGPMDLIKGRLENPANFSGWKIVPIVRLLEAELKKRKLPQRIHFQNDAIAAALGEGWTGQAQGCSTYAMITCGTGIGSGVILNGKPAQSRGMGSEWGHLIANCTDLSTSDPKDFYERTVEGLASGTGLIRRAKKQGFAGHSTRELAYAASSGDALALKLFSEASEALASIFFGLSIGFHPEIFVVSGGLLGIREHFLPQSIEIYRRLMKPDYSAFLAPIKVARLGTKAGVVGAARLPLLAAN